MYHTALDISQKHQYNHLFIQVTKLWTFSPDDAGVRDAITVGIHVITIAIKFNTESYFHA